MNKERAAWIGLLVPAALLVVWLCLHLPFLDADPDTTADVHTRGAWTDEGLYSGTARNFLNTGTIDPYENSLLTRGPLQTVLQIPVFFLFGQSLVVARLMTLLGVVLAFVFLMRYTDLRLAGLFLLVAGFTQFHLFHFSHYAMAEAFSTALIIIAIVFMVRAYSAPAPSGQWRRSLFIAAALLFGAYSMKIQFVYAAALLPGVGLVLWLPHLRSDSAERVRLMKMLGFAIAVTAAFAALYAVAWYLPNRDFYHFVMSREVDSRFHTTLTGIWQTVRFNFNVLLFVPYLKPLIVAGGLSLAGGVTWLVVRPSQWRPVERILFIAAVVWFFLELHKVAMNYMPHRYLVPAYASVALMVAVTLAVAARQRLWTMAAASVVVSLMAGWQLRHTHEAWERRSYDLKKVNTYLKQYDWTGKTITGAWGPSAAWGTKAKVFPVWHGFVNDHRALDGTMIITESDQADSDMSLSRQGVDADAVTDSLRRFPVWRYEIDLRWIHREPPW